MKQPSSFITGYACSTRQTLMTNRKCHGLTALPTIVLITVCGLFLSARQQASAAGPQCTAPYVQVQGQVPVEQLLDVAGLAAGPERVA